MANLITKPCEGNCGKILEDVYPTRRFCNACQTKKRVRWHQEHSNKGRYTIQGRIKQDEKEI